MISDMVTVMWKERKSLFRVRGRRSQALLALMSPTFLAVYFGVQGGMDFTRSAFSLLLAFIVPLLVVGMGIPDSFAGERERHTLPTLLASRLPDRAILFGKLATSVALGWGMTVLFLMIGLVTFNIAHWTGRIQFFALRIFVADLAVSLVVSLLTAGLGVLFSLRASTVQEAQQSTMGVLLVLPMILQFGSLFLLSSDSGIAWLRRALGVLSFEQIVGVIVAILAAISALLLWAALARFKRARLILSS